MRKKCTKTLALLLAASMMLAACGSDSGDKGNDSSGGVAEESQSKQENDSQNDDSQNDDSQSDDSQGDDGQEAGGTGKEYPEYLNMDSAYPIIKDEYAGDVKLTMAYTKDANGNEWDDAWISKYYEDKYNVVLDVEGISGSTLSERRSIMFSSADLPDIMMEMWINTAMVMEYGVEEGMLLKLDEYISEELTPGIWHFLYGEYSAERADCTAPDGHIYTLPYLISKENASANDYIMYYKPYLDAVGADLPETLDEFVDAMYKIKEADPAGVGSENMYPWGGGMGIDGDPWFIINSLGYITDDNYGYGPALRNGELVIPVYDMDVYQEFLKLMNQFYNDGIINPNYFTIESSEVTAQMLAGQNATYYQSPVIIGMEDDGWVAAKPLTSQWNDTPATRYGTFCALGNMAISAETEHPELCMRILDTFYNCVTDNCGVLAFGPTEEYSYGFAPRYIWDEEEGRYVANEAELPEGTNAYTYWVQDILTFDPHMGAIYLPECDRVNKKALGHEVTEAPMKEGTRSLWENVWPYCQEGFPRNYYLQGEMAERKTDLETVINPYIKEQVALFITGERPLSEVDAFREELKGMGIEELLDVYKEIYDTYQSVKTE